LDADRLEAHGVLRSHLKVSLSGDVQDQGPRAGALA
ncbi:MAG: hypothetical protein QOD62_1882, partial [Actinomycetota bacterium]|nr:hypothetical protein [Actinomycetota bacterium]